MTPTIFNRDGSIESKLRSELGGIAHFQYLKREHQKLLDLADKYNASTEAQFHFNDEYEDLLSMYKGRPQWFYESSALKRMRGFVETLYEK